MRTTVVAAILFLLVGNVLADPQPWMERENADELLVDFSEARCPTGAYGSIIESVLAGARIRQATQGDQETIYLRIKLHCFPVEGGEVGFAYQFNVTFGIYQDDVRLIYEDYGSDVIGTLPPGSPGVQFLENRLRTAVQEAITDYLKANFDL